MSDDQRDEIGEALLAALLRGEGWAWAKFLAEMNVTLRLVVENILFVSPDAGVDPSDVVQTCVTKAFEKRATFRGKTLAEFQAWVIQIARNQAVSDLRDAIRHKEHEQNASRQHKEAFSPSSGKSSMYRRQLTRVLDALNRLPPAQREAVRLRKLEQWPVLQIAARLGRTPKATYGLIKRGMLELHKDFGNGNRESTA